MASATDDELAAMVSNWQALQEEHKLVSDSLANIVADFPTIMAALQSELETTIDEMNLSEEAAQGGKDTIQGFINGAEGMFPAVEAAYARIANAASSALSRSYGGSQMVAVGVDGSHAGGLDYVPFDGYIAQLHQGERVLTSAEAEAYNVATHEEVQMVTFAPQFLSYLSAMNGGHDAVSVDSGGSTATHSGSFAPTFNVTYNVSGTNTEGITNALTASNNDLRQFICEVIDDRVADIQRRSY